MYLYKKKIENDLYQGESFSDEITKKDDVEWEDNEIAEFKLYNTAGSTIYTGSLVRSINKLNLTFILGQTNTTSLFGVYRLLVYLSDTVTTEMNEVISEYRLNFKKTTARND